MKTRNGCENPICPHCNADVLDVGVYSTISSFDLWCPECGKEFSCFVETKTIYWTNKKEQSDDKDLSDTGRN